MVRILMTRIRATMGTCGRTEKYRGGCVMIVGAGSPVKTINIPKLVEMAI